MVEAKALMSSRSHHEVRLFWAWFGAALAILSPLVGLLIAWLASRRKSGMGRQMIFFLLLLTLGVAGVLLGVQIISRALPVAIVH